ncbi:aminopeptidase P N-terminal domain-containing protein [Nocardioides convexus]|uniref:aminopeptidase P N-terminal domain-containing protein n=1 Tax=Nocardioides convexus TaxID=2712224 RepID=UPI00241831CB|nr:aminopeptidase P N-terminal domain-containing protein [Nocardioides convexus]
MTEDTPTEPKTEQHDPAVPEAYAAFMRTGWDDRPSDVQRHPVADLAAARRQRLAEAFPGERLVLPGGGYQVRAFDTDYRFRADTAHAYFSGNHTSDATLVVEPDGSCVLYARPRSGRDSDEFFRDRQYGALWAGKRPSAEEPGGCPRRRGPPRRRPRRGARQRHQDPRAPPGLRGRRRPGRRRRGPRHRVGPGALGDAPGQGRVGGRRACSPPSTRPRSASRTACASGTG